MAKAAGVSYSSVQRIWRAHGLKPHLIKIFKVSRDMNFAAKLEDVVGLYPDPPDKAMVLCVGEKSQMHSPWRRQQRRRAQARHHYLDKHNANPKPFIWTKSAGEILEKVARAKQALESQH